MKIILGGNGPTNNRGCAAIAYGTKKILEKEFEAVDIISCSFGHPERRFAVPGIREVGFDLVRRRWSARWWKYWMSRGIGRKLDYGDFAMTIEPLLGDAAAYLSVGGDNYAIEYGFDIVERLMALDALAVKRGVPTIVWGASVGPFSQDRQFERRIFDHFRSLGLIVVREPDSYEYLQANSVRDNVVLAPDPSFAMAPERVELPARLNEAVEQGPIGLNLSPLMAKFVCGGDLEAWHVMGAEIVARCVAIAGRPVVLIPHVGSTNGDARMDDEQYLQKVWNRLGDNVRSKVEVAPGSLRSPEVKWLISRCHAFIGARTHSYLAAVSTGVPAIAVAYSRKGTGLCRWVFGDEHWCIRAVDLTPAAVGVQLEQLLGDHALVRQNLAQFAAAAHAEVFNLGARVRALIN